MNQRRALLSGAAVALAAVLSFGTSAAMGQSILLKPKFEKGQKNYVELTVNATQKSGPVTYKVDRVFGLVEEVEEAGSDETRFRLTIDRMGFSLTGEPVPLSFDSDLPDRGQSEELVPIFRPMLGMRMSMVVGKDLQVKSFKGVKAISKKVAKSAAGNPLLGEFSVDLTASKYRGRWGSERLILFPNKEVKVGDTWAGSFTFMDAWVGKMQNKYECKLESVTEKDGAKEATVSFKVVMSKIGEPKKPRGEDSMTYRFISSESEGTAVFNSSVGCFVKITETTKTKAEGEQAGQSVPIDITAESKLSVLTVEKHEQEKDKRRQSRGQETHKKGGKPEKKPPQS
jgi:hypothetical protein